MELKKVGNKTYYIENPTNIGVYLINEKDVYLIDSGSDKDAGKKVLKLLEAEGLSVKGIISTHSNADHIGANRLIQDRTGCKIFASGIEKCFTEFPSLEPSFLYGGYPFKELTNKFLCAKESKVSEIEGSLPDGLKYFSLKGHFFDMIGVMTDDGVYFLGDSLFGEETINKYHVFFIYDVKEYLATLDFLSGLEGKLFIASHCRATEDISSLIDLNRQKVLEIADLVCELCSPCATFEDVLKGIFDKYGLAMNANQYVLIGSTVRSYLSYLYGLSRISYEFVDNRMIWKRI